MHGLKINLDAIVRDQAAEVHQGLCSDGIHLGSLHISSEGLITSGGVGPSYVLSLHDLSIVPNEEGGFLGQGSSGSVRRAIHRRTGVKVALKEIKCTDSVHLNEIRRELETLHTREDELCPYLAKLFGAFCHEGSVLIAMECLDGSLDHLRQPVPCPVLACITRRILHGLAYLHRTRHLMHRDLKPSNVLYRRRTGDVKLSDFGISSCLEYTAGCAQSFVGTVTYMSPERLHGGTYSYAADIWSLGLLVAELATGECAFARLRGGSTEARFWALVQHLRGGDPVLDLPAHMDAELRHFILACLRKTPEQRPRCDELLVHPFILKYAGGGEEVSSRSRSGGGGVRLSAHEQNDHATMSSTTTTVSSSHGICVNHVMDESDKRVIRRWLCRQERTRLAGRNLRTSTHHSHCNDREKDRADHINSDDEDSNRRSAHKDSIHAHHYHENQGGHRSNYHHRHHRHRPLYRRSGENGTDFISSHSHTSTLVSSPSPHTRDVRLHETHPYTQQAEEEQQQHGLSHRPTGVCASLSQSRNDTPSGQAMPARSEQTTRVCMSGSEAVVGAECGLLRECSNGAVLRSTHSHDPWDACHTKQDNHEDEADVDLDKSGSSTRHTREGDVDGDDLAEGGELQNAPNKLTASSPATMRPCKTEASHAEDKRHHPHPHPHHRRRHPRRPVRSDAAQVSDVRRDRCAQHHHRSHRHRRHVDSSCSNTSLDLDAEIDKLLQL